MKGEASEMDLMSGNGNGKGKTTLTIAVMAAVAYGLLAWEFKTTQDLQVQIAQHDQRIIGLREDYTNLSHASQAYQEASRQTDTKIFDIITELRIQLGVSKQDGGQPKGR